MKLSTLFVLGWACVAWLGVTAGQASADHGRIEVHEPAGLERERWPIQVGVPMDGDVSAGELVLVQVGDDGALTAVPFQVLDEVAPAGVEPGGDGIKTFEIAFAVDLPADGSLELRLYAGAPDAEVAPAGNGPSLTVEQGDGLARSVDTHAARFAFHSASGQMTGYRLPGHDEVDFGGRAIHGGGDVWAPDFGRWGNVRSWDTDNEDHAITYTETAGPIAWQLVRSGRMPNTNGHVDVSVSYTAYAGTPFVLSSSRIRFNEATRVNAVRTNQLVFGRMLHTHGVVIDHAGDVATTRAYDPDDTDRRLGHVFGRLEPDVPFVGMFHADEGYGIGMVTLGRANPQTRRLASPQDSGAHIYFFDVTHPRLDFFYVIRAEVFPADFDGTSHTWNSTVIPEGSEFVSRSAIVAFEVDGDDDERYADIERWTKLLRHPPRVVAR